MRGAKRQEETKTKRRPWKVKEDSKTVGGVLARWISSFSSSSYSSTSKWCEKKTNLVECLKPGGARRTSPHASEARCAEWQLIG